MAYNKLNTFHWHISDSHSFPLDLPSLPNMALYGAYSPQEVYSADDVRELVKYARVRGIRILPEIDAPSHAGHGWQWGEKENLGPLVVCLDEVSLNFLFKTNEFNQFVSSDSMEILLLGSSLRTT